MPLNKKRAVFTSDKLFLTQKEFEQKVKEANTSANSKNAQMSSRTVTVSVFDIFWLFKDIDEDKRGFVDITEAITECQRQAVFESNFVIDLLDKFWNGYKNVIVL